MRIPYPERVPINRVVFFAVALFAIQMLEGTAPYFSIGCAIFILIAAFAFNAGGGLTRASGAYVFFYSVLVVIIGLCYKAILGEPAQSNLLDPRTDIEAYVGSIAAMYVAVVVSRRFSRKTALLQNLLTGSKMYRASVGCIAFGIVGGVAIAALGESGARLESAFNQLNQLIPLGIIIGVMYEIRRSGGTRSTNLAIALGAAYLVIDGGVLYFSKSALLLPLICWILPVCALQFRLSRGQVLAVLMVVFVFFRYLTPYSQYGRGQVPLDATMAQRLKIAIPLLEHPDETRRIYNQGTKETGAAEDLNAYYDSPQGFWERLQMISVDDKLIDVTDRGRVIGLFPLKIAFLNAVPHFLWPDKPEMNTGNYYFHEINGQATYEGDTDTGISFSPTSEAYHVAGWVGVLIIAPILWSMLFIEFDLLCGDLRSSPWGLLFLAFISHVAPEGALSNMIYVLTFGVEIFVFCAFFATWFAPLLAIPILGPDRQKSERSVSLA